jgi:hypothetical protein
LQGLCYNTARGWFVVDDAAPEAPAEEALPMVNVRAADPEHDHWWAPARVRASALSASERRAALVLARPVLVAMALWPGHVTHAVVNLLLPLQAQMAQTDARVRAAAPTSSLARLWHTDASAWATATADPALAAAAAAAVDLAVPGPVPVTAVANAQGQRAAPEGDGVWPAARALAAVEAAAPSYDLVLLADGSDADDDDQGPAVPAEALRPQVARVGTRGAPPTASPSATAADEMGTRCYARAVVGLGSRCPYAYCTHRLRRADYDAVRARVLAAYGADSGSGSGPGAEGGRPVVVVVERRGTRRWLNVHEVVRAVRVALPDALVVPVALEGWPVGAQVRLFARATVVVAVHGNALGHLLWMAPAHSHVIEVFQLGYRTAFFEELAVATGVGYHPVRCADPACADAAELDAGLPAKARSVAAPLPALRTALAAVASAVASAHAPAPTSGSPL